MLEFPKATYMYWQKRFNRTNPDQEIEEIILDIRKRNPNYGYRSICGELRNRGYIINKKKVQRLVQKLGLQVTSFTRKSRRYNSYIRFNIGLKILHKKEKQECFCFSLRSNFLGSLHVMQSRYVFL